MAKQASPPGNYVKKQTLTIAVCVALAVGFAGGLVFGVYKSMPRKMGAGGMPPGVTSRTQARNQGPAVADLEKETADHPDDAAAWARLGHHYFDSNQVQKAIGAYEKSLALNTKNADVWTDLGVMYRRSGKPKKALEAFDTAMRVDPKHEVSRFNKGIVLLHDLKDRRGAIRAWESLLAINPFAMAPNGQSVDQMVQMLKKMSKP